MPRNILIQADHLYRRFGDIRAIHDLSFALKQGQVLGFLGPNGAGKSTTMQLLTGNLALNAGCILIDGIDLLDQPRQAKSRIGYLPEHPPLYRELSVDEYLSYCARLHRLPRSGIANAVDWAKTRCGLQDVSRRLLGNLSKGYQQRVGIAQAIVHNPAVVILDEPTVGLDPIQIRQIRGLIQELGQEHAVILSTHIMQEVQAVCSHVQIIHQGRLVYADSLANLDQQQPCLRITLERPPEANELAKLPIIEQVEVLGNGRFLLYYPTDTDPVEKLVTYICAQGWGLRELRLEGRSLEQIFIELTLAEECVA